MYRRPSKIVVSRHSKTQEENESNDSLWEVELVLVAVVREKE